MRRPAAQMLTHTNTKFKSFYSWLPWEMIYWRYCPREVFPFICTPYQNASASLCDNVELGTFFSLFNRLLPNLPEASRTSRNLQVLAVKMASLLFALVPATSLQSYSMNSSRLQLFARKNHLKSSHSGRPLVWQEHLKLSPDSRHGLPWKWIFGLMEIPVLHRQKSRLHWMRQCDGDHLADQRDVWTARSKATTRKYMWLKRSYIISVPCTSPENAQNCLISSILRPSLPGQVPASWCSQNSLLPCQVKSENHHPLNSLQDSCSLMNSIHRNRAFQPEIFQQFSSMQHPGLMSMGKKSSESPLASFRFTGIAILRSLRWEKAALATGLWLWHEGRKVWCTDVSLTPGLQAVPSTYSTCNNI